MKSLLHTDLVYPESMRRSIVVNTAVSLLSNLASITVGYNHLSYEVIHVGLLEEVERIIVGKCASLDDVDRLFPLTQLATRASSRPFLKFLHEIGCEIHSADPSLGNLLTRIDSKNLDILVEFMHSKGSLLRSKDNALVMVVRSSQDIREIPEILASKYEIKYSILNLQTLIKGHRLRVEQIEEELKMKLKVSIYIDFRDRLDPVRCRRAPIRNSYFISSR